MTDRRAGAIAGMIVVSALVWIVTAELAWPVRFYTTFLLVVLPMMAVAQVPLAEEDPTALPRLPLYASSAVALWILAAGALGAAVLGDLPPRAIGLAPVPAGALVGWSLGTLAAALVLALLGHALGIRESAILEHMLPRTGRERLAFIGLSFSAGVCEELVFRGFLIPALEMASGSLAVAVLFSAIVFGTLHAYQHVRGAARAASLGLLMTVPFLATGSVVPSMIAHFAYDVVAGIWLGRRVKA